MKSRGWWMVNGGWRRTFVLMLFAIHYPLSTIHCLHAASNQIDNLSLTDSEDGSSTVLAVESSRKLSYEAQEVGTPPRIILKMKEEVPCPRVPAPASKNPQIREITLACEGSGNSAKLTALTIALKEKPVFTIAQRDWILTVTVRGNAGLSSAPDLTPQKPAENAGYKNSKIEIESYRDLEDLEPNRRTLSAQPTLDEVLNVGLANYRPLEIAQKELKLADQKLFEARRNFFPNVTARAAQSAGSTLINPADIATRADFQRKEVGVELGQPLFQSGRLYYSEKGARAQRDISELAISKIAQEATFDILKNLFTYIQTKESLALRRSLLTDSAKIVDNTKKKRDVGVASESEYLGVLSAGNQIEYKAVSEEKDFEIARSRLMGVLNVESLPLEFPISLEDLCARKVPATNLDLDALLALGLSNRPEIKSAYLSKKMKEYARMVARAEYLIKVDASGFVGQSGAAFASENISMKDAYNFGLRGTLYFGGSSVSPQLSREKTAPDLGSNSRTETRAESVNVGLLDSLGARSNYFQSQIEEDKAREEYSANRKQIVIEVKEAFFNYQRAKIQIDTAKKELEYRKKEAAIAQTKDRLHQIEATQYLQAVAGMTESEVGIREAMSYYLTAFAALEKATGQPLTR